MRKLRIVVIVLLIFILTGCTKEVENKEITINLNGVEIVGHYSGNMTDGMPDGDGTFVVYDEDSDKIIWKYSGAFKNGNLKGEGKVENFSTIIENNGYNYTGIYTGDVSDALSNGNGKFICDAEDSNWEYDGNFVNNIISGNGKIEDFPLSVELQDNTYAGTYSGDVLDGKPEGEGTFKYNDEKDISIEYNGNWRDGKMEGKGELSSNNFCINFSQVKRIGTFKGVTENGVANGEGTFEAATDENISYTYSGGWKDGTWNGYGEQTFEENEKGLIDRKGNFSDGEYLPTPGELMVYLTGSDLKFSVSNEKKDYLDKNKDLILNWKEKGNSDLIDSQLTYEKYMKKNSAYETTFMESKTIEVSQIWEEDTEMTLSGSITTLLNFSDAYRVYYIIYMGSLPDVYEGTKIKMIGVPISNGSYQNLYGGETNCIVFLAVDVEIK